MDGTLAEIRPEYVVGLDLGQAQDFTAMAVLDRSRVTYTEVDAATWQRKGAQRCRLVAMERMALGTPYPEIVRRTEAVVNGLMAPDPRPTVARAAVTLVVDATGVGAPVVDMLRATRLTCGLMPVQITAGLEARQSGSTWHVPKRDLVVGLQAAMQQKQLQIAAEMPLRHELMRELLGMRATLRESGCATFSAQEGAHDDLVMALALAMWCVRARVRKSGWGPARLL